MEELSEVNDMCKGPEIGAGGLFNRKEANVAGVQFRLNNHYYVIMGVREYKPYIIVRTLVFNLNETRSHRWVGTIE